ncbi:Zinc finger protein MAGPIE [Apostasia shenzhenica]|uniref:Protein EARLY HEADING DATE 2 n=1 Tax=Apostasia shenzhenica TaxID=1088818 RepID=A0A2I0B749_9ASPA|nr:Zinc finger protein MAGPIE [Apostasia shenzhenica]
MMKGKITPLQQQQAEENMSNLTTASGEASVSSNQQSSFISPNFNPNPPLPAKKKRNLPGNPDPEAEVVALSPKTLMATNRFICEICNKGFQRDQNLQLHRRGHNLPWKLKQRSSKEVRKKVYICPEVTCVHHEPTRALGDLTGIKKHFSRKHGEKKWKCEKCSKKYAVQSDWKAHSKICGTREYRCDCGTLFSRRDSFITHRAFCDALAEESVRAMAANPLLTNQQHLLFPPPPPPPAPPAPPANFDPLPHLPLHPQLPHLMRPASNDAAVASGNSGCGNGLRELTMKREAQPPSFDSVPSWLADLPSSLYPHDNPLPPFPGPAAAPAHMSATALLQKAAQMGATMSRPARSGIGLSSSRQEAVTGGDGSSGSGQFLKDLMMGSLPEASGFDGGSFAGVLRSTRRENGQGRSEEGGNEGLTRDFLGLRALSQRDFLSMAGFEPCISSSSSSPFEQQSKKPW